jgi:hypothetical protein
MTEISINPLEPERQCARYPFDHFPVIDYRAHRAYGGFLPKPRLKSRLRALRWFAFGLAMIAGRLLVDYEHLPKPKNKSAKLRWMLSRSPMYARLVFSQKIRRVFARNKFSASSPKADEVLAVLKRDGAICVRLNQQQVREMRDLLEGHFQALKARLASKRPQDRHFDETRLWLDRDKNADVFAWFTDVLGSHGVLEASSIYLNRPVGVAHVNPQINDPSDNFWANHFVDAGVEDSRCDYCHFDSTYNVLKMIIYVSDVAPKTGPFSFVRGSHRADSAFFDGIIRRANDYGGLSSTRRQCRELFNALPKFLQRKAAFGPDVPNDSKYVSAIVDHEWTITSDQGHCILFDPCGIHRGGMVQDGERLVVSVMLAEIPD